jgi:calreticulin
MIVFCVVQLGHFTRTGGKYPPTAESKGIQTSADARFYSLTRNLDEQFDNKNKDLIIAYTVKHEQDIDCGGAYIKLLPPGFEPKKFGGDTPYAIMFGPDVCGYSTRKTHVRDISA